MKKIIIFCLFISSNSFAISPDFNTETNIVTFPRVTVNGNESDAFNNVELFLNPSGDWEILKLTEEDEDSVNLTGSWSASGSDGVRGMFGPTSCYRTVQLWLIHSGTELSGRAEVTQCSALEGSGGKGIIKGTTEGDKFYFEVIMENSTLTFDEVVTTTNGMVVHGSSMWDADYYLLLTFSKHTENTP